MPMNRIVLSFSLGLVFAMQTSADILVVEGNDVRRYSDGGTFLGTFASGMSTPIGVAHGGTTGPVFVGQFGNGEIRKFTADGRDMGVVLGGQPDWQPAGLAFSGGRLYAASIRHKALASYAPDADAEDGDTNTPSSQQILPDLPVAPHGIAPAEPNDLPGVYFTTSNDETGEGTLSYWDGMDGNREMVICTFEKGAKPRGVVAADGNVFVALLGAGKVVKVTAAGAIEDWMSPLNSFSGPQYVGENTPVGLVAHDGKLYVSAYGMRDLGGRKVFSYRLADKIPQETITSPFPPQYLAFVTPLPEDRTGDSGFVSLGGNGTAGNPVLRATADLKSATLPFLSWDSEGGDRARLNLLRSGVLLQGRAGEKTVPFTGTGVKSGEDTVVFELKAQDAHITWTVRIWNGGMTMDFRGTGAGLSKLEGLELVFPFDASATATCPFPSEWTRDRKPASSASKPDGLQVKPYDAAATGSYSPPGEWGNDGKLIFPALLHAPDLGILRVSCPQKPDLLARWQGRREFLSTTLTLELPVPTGAGLTLNYEPWNLPQPREVSDAEPWKAARRGWLNAIQANTHRPAGDFAHGINYPENPPGVWANNVISDPVSSTVFWLADHVLLLPEPAPGISVAPLLRRTVELWMYDAISPEGQVCYVYKGGTPMDGNPSVLIGAWAYVEASGDTDWLKANIERLEFLSAFMEGRDIDGDGLIESPQSGNRNSHSHGETAWDCISSGHKNAYVNALAYRAWRGLAALQKKLGRDEKAAKYTALAERLKQAFIPAFLNPETGWLGWWRSADGELHDVWSDMPTSLAINNGLVTPEQGRVMLDKYWAELQKTGFDNFELGLPLNIRPIPPSLMLTGFGGKLEDGSDNYGKWLNGGLCLSNTSFWLAANYAVGRPERADMVLNAMLARQNRGVFPNGGAFQNGIVDSPPNGGENFDWKGNPAGYEGHLVYSWLWMQSMMLKDPATRQRVYGILH